MALETLEDRCVPATGSPSGVLVPAFYQSLLGRAPDYPGASGFTLQLDRGVLPEAVALQVMDSPSNEFRYGVVDADYVRFLGRHGNVAELMPWADQLAGGVTQQQVAARIAGSDEAYNLAGGNTLAWLNRVYTLALGRSDTEGAWVADVGPTVASRQFVAAGIFSSGEAARVLVAADYVKYLGRAPGATEPGAFGFAAQMQAGARHELVIAQILGSLEYYLRQTQPIAGDNGSSSSTAGDNGATATPQADTLAGGSGGAATTTDAPPATTPSSGADGGGSGTSATNALTLHLDVNAFTVVPVIKANVSATYPASSAPLQVAIDVDLNQDGTFSGAAELGVGTVTVAPGGSQGLAVSLPTRGNWLVRARTTDASGHEVDSNTATVHVAVMDLAALGDSHGSSGAPGGAPSVGSGAPPLGSVDVGGGAAGDFVGDPSGPGHSQLSLTDGTSASGQREKDTTESEPNNSAATANSVSLAANTRTVIDGSISTGTDLDYYTFTLSSRAGVFLDIDSREIGLSSTLDTVLTLYTSTGTQLDSNDNGYDFDTGYPAPVQQPDSTTADSALYRDLAAGTYVVRVSSVSSTTGSYKLKILADTGYSTTVPTYNSNPGAKATLFLDFAGYAATDDWGTYSAPAFDLNSDTSEFTPGELLAIKNIWRMVAEDYSPFNINVTTNYTGTIDDLVAHRQVITSDDGTIVSAQGSLGISFENSFSANGASDDPAFTFCPNFSDPTGDTTYGGGSSGLIMAATVEEGNTSSHETGHTLGLLHYGGSTKQLQAIMNTPDEGLNREIWASGSTKSDEPPVTTQDDMAVISNSTNAFGYRTDDFGDTLATAAALTPTGLAYGASGIISQVASDVDVFRFATGGGGNTVIHADVDDYINDLNVKITLYNAAGTALAGDDPSNSFDASLSVNLPSGIYYVAVASHGDAGEAGQYALNITVPSLPPPGSGGGGGSGGGSSGGAGGAAGGGLADDAFESNNNSDRASAMGTLTGSASYTDLTINRFADGTNDQDFYRWTMGTSGTFSVQLSNISSSGDLHFRAYKVNADTTLSEIASGTRIGHFTSQSGGAAVSANEDVIVYVFGFNFADGSYDMAVGLS
jgi:hypothetical protein